MTLHKRRKGRMIGPVTLRQEPLKELPVREVADHTEPQEGGKLVRKVMAHGSARHRQRVKVIAERVRESMKLKADGGAASFKADA